MDTALMLILVVVFAIASWVAYHTIFEVAYFDLGAGIFKEIVGSIIAGIILATITLYFWWITAIIIIIAGAIGMSKKQNPAPMVIAVILAIVIAIVGIRFKKQISDDESSKSTPTPTTVYSNTTPTPTEAPKDTPTMTPTEAPKDTPTMTPTAASTDTPMSTLVADTNAWSEAIVSYFGEQNYIGWGIQTKLIAYDESNLIYKWYGGGGNGSIVQSRTNPTCFNNGNYNLNYLYVCYLGVNGPYYIQENENELSKTMTIPYNALTGEYYSDYGTCVITINDNVEAEKDIIGKIAFSCERSNDSGELFHEQGDTYGVYVMDDGARYLVFFKDDKGNLYFKFDLYGVQATFYKK